MASPAFAAETVTLSASSASITYGRSVSLSGTIAGDPGCIGGRTVWLAWRLSSADPWTVIDSSTTAADGTFLFSNAPSYSGGFRAQLPSSGSCANAASTGVPVKVAALVDTAAVAASLEAGSCVEVDVTVSPPKPGQTVQLQRRTDGTWSTISTLTLDGVSHASASPCFGWEDIGLVRLRVKWPAPDALNATGTGITLPFQIVEAGWMKAIDVAAAGHSVSVAVGDDGDAMYERADTAPRRPASNEKLLLSLALLDRFGPDHRIPTFAAAKSVTGGVVRGDLWVLGRGDPEIRSARLGALAAALEHAGIRRVAGRVMGATTYFRHDWFARGWKRSFPGQEVALPSALTFDHNVARGRAIRDPERRAAAALTDKLERRGIRVRGRPGDGAPPDGVSPVADIGSRPLISLLASMDRPSDNWYAEVLGKALAAARSGPPGTIRKGANAIEAFAGESGATFSLFDSSGLSYDNRVTAAGILRLLTVATDRTWGADLRRALPAGGQGTLEDRLRDVRVRAKTGTLDGASALSGWVWLERENQWAEFSILSAGMSKSTAVRIEDKVVHVLANRATLA
jgi:serine-type D-Ala-D-Ala carboxypeptidase/endopeptidase (penicillin-binding protein 4)